MQRLQLTQQLQEIVKQVSYQIRVIINILTYYFIMPPYSAQTDLLAAWNLPLNLIPGWLNCVKYWKKYSAMASDERHHLKELQG